MSTTFMLVRHGTCALMDKVLFGRTVDTPLDSHGELQCAALAERVASIGDLTIHASPRRRTCQTAAAIAERARCAFTVRPELDEVDFGSWSGQSFAALATDARWRSWNEHRGSARTPVGETMSCVQQRIVGHIEHLRRQLTGGTIVLVSHAEIIRSAVMHYLHVPADLYHRIEIGPASVSIICFDERDVRVVL